MAVVFWVIVGALLGCATAALTGAQTNMRLFSFAVVGIFGAVISGLLFSTAVDGGVIDLNITGAIVVTLGALLLLLAVGRISSHPKKHN